MDKKIIISGFLGIVIGATGMFLANSVNDGSMGDRYGHRKNDKSLHGNSHMHESMDDMMSALEGKTGDAFDKAFLAEMIVHHEGAVAMAQAALAQGSNPELKALAEAIIAAQEAEITQMKKWQESWYGAQ